MRIGELAEAAGVSTRTVRHYHHVGVLPEPERSPSGYREYALRDLVRLSHARRLVELGLSLDEVRDVLADEEGRDLGEIIEAMDVELATQQERLAIQRRRLAELRARVHGGQLGVDDLPEPDLVEFFKKVEAAGATGRTARLDHDLLAFVPAEERTRAGAGRGGCRLCSPRVRRLPSPRHQLTRGGAAGGGFPAYAGNRSPTGGSNDDQWIHRPYRSDTEGRQLPMYRLTVVYDEPADKEAFDRRYTDEHVPLVKAVPGLGSFQLSHPQGGTPYLVADLFWPSEDAYTASAASPEMAETRKHAEGCGTTYTVYTGDVAEV